MYNNTGREAKKKRKKKKQHQMEEGGVRQQNCSKLVKETQRAAAESWRKATTKPERGRSRASSQGCACCSHMYTLTHLQEIKERDTFNIKAAANT